MPRPKRNVHNTYTCPSCGHSWWAVERPITRCPHCGRKFYPRAAKNIIPEKVLQGRMPDA